MCRFCRGLSRHPPHPLFRPLPLFPQHPSMGRWPQDLCLPVRAHPSVLRFWVLRYRVFRLPPARKADRRIRFLGIVAIRSATLARHTRRPHAETADASATGSSPTAPPSKSRHASCTGSPSAAIVAMAAYRLLGRAPPQQLTGSFQDRHPSLQLPYPLAGCAYFRLFDAPSNPGSWPGEGVIDG